MMNNTIGARKAAATSKAIRSGDKAPCAKYLAKKSFTSWLEVLYEV